MALGLSLSPSDCAAVPGVLLRRCCMGLCCSWQSSDFGGVLSSCADPFCRPWLRSRGKVSSSSFCSAACASVVPEVVCGRKGGFCLRATSFRFCFASVPTSPSVLLSTRMNSVLNGPWHHHVPKELGTCGISVARRWAAVVKGERGCCACLRSPSFFLGPFQCDISYLERLTPLTDVRKGEM